MAGPLDGIRILDLSQHFSGPFGTVLLADQGAEVIKVEAPGVGDGLRHTHPQRNGVSAMFATVNRNKRAIAVDMRTEAGKKVFRDLAATADVVVQNFRPGVMERLGFGYAALAAINPTIILLSINGFGSTGPYADRRTYEGIVQAVAGFAAAQADAGTGERRFVQTAVCDKLTAVLAAQAITAALLARERGGGRQGQAIELPMLDAALWFLWPDIFFNQILRGEGWTPAPRTTGFFRVFDTTDGQVIILMMSQEEFVAACRALNCEGLTADPRFAKIGERYLHLNAVNALLAPKVAAFSTEQLMARLRQYDVPSAPVNDLDEVLQDPQVLARGVVECWEHPKGGPITQPSHPIKFASMQSLREPAPAMGQDTDRLLEALGYSDTTISALRQAGTVS